MCTDSILISLQSQLSQLRAKNGVIIVNCQNTGLGPKTYC